MRIKSHTFRVIDPFSRGVRHMSGPALLRQMSVRDIEDAWGEYVDHSEWCPCAQRTGSRVVPFFGEVNYSIDPPF